MNAKDRKLYLDILQGCAAIHADGAAARAEAKERFEAVVKVRRVEQAERTIRLAKLVGGVGLIAAVLWCREQEGLWHLTGFAVAMVLCTLAMLDQGQELAAGVMIGRRVGRQKTKRQHLCVNPTDPGKM